MIFNVMVVVGKNADDKQIVNMVRVYDSKLSEYLRSIQNAGHYIIAVIPLFRVKPLSHSGVIHDVDDSQRIERQGL